MNQGMSTHIGYDRYGRGQFALRATYRLTATPSQYGAATPASTAEKVDTNSGGPQPRPTISRQVTRSTRAS